MAGPRREVIAAAVIGGWLFGVASTLPEIAVALLFAVLARGVVLSVLRESPGPRVR